MAAMAYIPRTRPIGRPSKGDRAEIMCRAALPVYQELRRRASDLGLPLSQYVADVLAQHVGRDDLVLELTQREESPLAV
jgi:hypothetical protein